MRLLTLVRAEFARILSLRMGLITLTALMIVPIVYGGLYLWGNADPYENLDGVPAALVVDDRGATVDDEAVNYGRDAADELLDDGTFGWVEVTDAEARAGVESGRFDFALAFPATFSADLASAATSLDTDDDPVRASLELTTDDTNSYLSTTLAAQAAETVRSTIAGELGESASRRLLDAVAEIRAGLDDAVDGSGDLADGAADAADGGRALASGATRLADGASDLNDGLDTLERKTADLPGGASDLADGASRLADGAGDLSTAAGQAAQLSAATHDAVARALAAAGVPDAQSAPLLARLDQLDQLTAGVDDGAGTLASGADERSDGADELAAQAPKLTKGIRQAADGASALADGADSAASGADELASGLGDLSAGADELHDELADGRDDIPATTASDRAATAEAIGDPLEVDRTALTEAQNYGAGLAPFFISLSAWIGIYALFLVLRPLSRRALTVGRAPLRTALAGWVAPAILGALQMVALFAIITLALGLQPVHALGLLAFMVLVSVTFAAIVLALNAVLGSVGQFLGLLLMIVQLVTAGGTFPWQTLPAPLAVLHQVLPMSHAVEGMRQLIYGGDLSTLGGAILPLLAWLAVALAATVWSAATQSRTRTLRGLRPSAIGG
jgi:putative membrane protein